MMKHTLITGYLLAACLCFGQNRSIARAASPLGDDFPGVRWGMTRSDVLRAMSPKQPLVADVDLLFLNTYLGQRARVFFEFANGKLAQVCASSFDQTVSGGTLATKAWLDGLITKFGVPQMTILSHLKRAPASVETIRQAATPEWRIGKAIAGFGMLEYRWETPRTRVEHRINKGYGGNALNVVVEFTSKELEAALNSSSQ